MRGPSLTAWEVRSAVLSGRAEELRAMLADSSPNVRLRPHERLVLEALINRYTDEARRVVVEG